MKKSTSALILALAFLAAPHAAAEDDPFTALFKAVNQAFSGGAVVDARTAPRGQIPSGRSGRAASYSSDSSSGIFGSIADTKARWSSEGSSWRQTCPQDGGRYVNVVGYVRSNRMEVRCGRQVIREFYSATAKINPKTGAPFYTPTGTFALKRNASTHYHKAWIFSAGRSGSPFEIHGYPTNDWETAQPSNWTLGCFALRNFEMDWLSGQVQNGTRFTVLDL